MENQHTTGFGTRTPTEACPEAIFLTGIQSIVGVVLQSAMVSAQYAGHCGYDNAECHDQCTVKANRVLKVKESCPCPCLIRAYRGAVIQLRPFLTTALDGSDRPGSLLVRLIPGKGPRHPLEDAWAPQPVWAFEEQKII
jgi:hypothetical protein